MGRLLAETFAKPSAAFLVPVPLHRGSDREYNQSELIARGASEVWGIPVRRMLFWKLGIERQALKRAKASRVLPVGAISAKPSGETGASVFLIDDVYTTGNTMRAAKNAIERAGLRVSGAMVWSRSEGRSMLAQGDKADEA